jgi:hypothetical protein
LLVAIAIIGVLVALLLPARAAGTTNKKAIISRKGETFGSSWSMLVRWRVEQQRPDGQ